MSDLYNEFVNIQNRDYSILKIAINPNNEDLIDIYKKYFNNHNYSITHNKFYNSGVDLFFPETIAIDGNFKVKMISMDVKCEMVDSNEQPVGYYMYPRSSISKTPLFLANQVGIIDSGYRGNLIGAFKSSDSEPYVVKKHTRLLQITNANLKPIFVKIVNESELSTTERGSGGFGSTGV